MAAGACDSAGFAIAIDPGHTRTSPGATSARGVPEVQFKVQLARVGPPERPAAGFQRALPTGREHSMTAARYRCPCRGPSTAPPMVQKRWHALFCGTGTPAGGC